MFVNDMSGSLVDVTARTAVRARRLYRHPSRRYACTQRVDNPRSGRSACSTCRAGQHVRPPPDPTLLRAPTLRREAQATSALEGTTPLRKVLTADADEPQATLDLVEILNYERMANYGFGWVGDGRPITTAFLEDLHGILMQGHTTGRRFGAAARHPGGHWQAGRRSGGSNPLAAARLFPPPGDHLKAGLDRLVGWMRQDHRARVDPVVATAMSHYQLETLHPFIDGNGRLGRLLIVLHLQSIGVLTEPTLTVSSWFEARRTDYYDHLLAVSARGDWDPLSGSSLPDCEPPPSRPARRCGPLVEVQAELADVVGGSNLRSANARALVDLAVASPSFTVRQVEARLGISHTGVRTP